MKFLMACLMALPLFAFSQRVKDKLIINGTLASGQTIAIIYDGALTDNTHVYMGVAFMNSVTKKDAQKSVRLTKVTQGWTDTVSIPLDATMLGVSFSDGNGEGDEKNYLFKLNKDAGKDIRSETDYDYYIERYTTYHLRKQADSLSLIAHKKYPEGNWLKKQYYDRFLAARSLVKMEYALGALLRKFPGIFTDPLFSKDLTYEIISKEAVDEENWNTYYFYSKRMSAGAKSKLDLQVVQRLSMLNKGTAFAERLATDLLQQDAKKNNNMHFEPAGSGLGYIEQKNKPEYDHLITELSYARLAYNNGHYRLALPYARHVALDVLNKKDTSAYELYLQIYAHTADPVTAMSAIEEYYQSSVVSNDEFKHNLRRLYIQINHSANGFDKYYAEIDSKQTDKLKEPVLKEKLNEQSPDFSLLNLEGKRVSLASLKGKVVVLDFWATWCYYCKQAFPSMKQVMQKFSADTSVVFLFIDTQENPTAVAGRKNQILPYLNANHFDFNVLFDEPVANGKSGDYQLYKAFNIQGLPTKYIIGTDGRIKFKEIGFNGSDEELIRRLSLMIEASR